MRVEYRKKFLRELALIPQKPRLEIEIFFFEVLPAAPDLFSVGKIEKMKGYPQFYKVRFGDYRLGWQLTDKTLVVERVAHRKDIYNLFP